MRQGILARGRVCLKHFSSQELLNRDALYRGACVFNGANVCREGVATGLGKKVYMSVDGSLVNMEGAQDASDSV